MSATIREAAPADVDTLVEVVLAAFEQHRGRLVPESGALGETAETLRARLEHGAALVAEEDGHAVGCVFFQEHEGDLYIGRLAVLPERRGRGLARALVEAALAWGREHGYAAARCGVRLALPENAGFFAALGFRPVDFGFHDGVHDPTFLWLRRPLESAP